MEHFEDKSGLLVMVREDKPPLVALWSKARFRCFSSAGEFGFHPMANSCGEQLFPAADSCVTGRFHLVCSMSKGREI
jgi:hypothetical protein